MSPIPINVHDINGSEETLNSIANGYNLTVADWLQNHPGYFLTTWSDYMISVTIICLLVVGITLFIFNYEKVFAWCKSHIGGDNP